jgi:signal peptidase
VRASFASISVFSVLVFSSPTIAAEQEELFVSRQVAPAGEYTAHIEGPAVDAGGALYVPNFGKDGVIGRLKPGAKASERFAELPAGSIGNGTRFDLDGRMYVADYKKHNVFVFEPGQTAPRIYFHSDNFTQPNDLAIAKDGTLYASDPLFGKGTGRIWRITRGPDGKVRGEVLAGGRPMGTTNGLDLSPDGATLYVGESNTNEIWAYQIEAAKLAAARLLIKLPGSPKLEIDGLRTDIDGRIFVTRPGNGTVAVITPEGKLLREVSLKGKDPTNLAFGGADGKTVYVTQKDGRFIEAFRVDRPGREPCLSKFVPGC